MVETNTELEYGAWIPPEQSIQIEYALSILSAIDRTVIEGFNRLRHGGVEVGGILFGVRNDRKVTVLDFKPFASEHALGPSFVLSSKDHLELAEMIANVKSDPAMQGRVPLGWYHSHTRSHIHLSAQDIELFDQHFPESWQIALVLRPDHFLPTKAGFFFREDDGRIHSEKSYCEFSLPALEPSQPVTTDREMLAERSVSAPGSAPSKPSGTARAVPAEFLPPVAAVSRGFGQRLSTLAMLGCLIIGILAGALFMNSKFMGSPVNVQQTIPPSQVEPLTLEDHAGHLRISWDRGAKPILESDKASLEITEGGRSSVVILDADQLHGGTVVYNRTSANVTVSLKAGNAEFSAVFAGQLPPAPPAAQIGKDNKGAEQANRIDAADRASTLKTIIPPRRTAPKAFVPAMMTRKAEPAAMSLVTPPVDRISAPAPVSEPLIGKLPVAPPPLKSAYVTTPVSAKPRAGSLIWTGRLSKNDVLSINGDRASKGSLTGAIPRHPVRIRVHPAELTDAGLKVYSSDPRYKAGHSEPPAANNGWNKTSYVQDSRLTDAVTVLEAPSAKNNWNRLVLRDKGAKLSILLIEWEEY